MRIEIRVPPLSESLTGGTLLPWRRAVGDLVARDETLIDLETDKVILEIPAPAAGRLVEVFAGEGDDVTAGQVIGSIEPAAGEIVAPVAASVVPARPVEPARPAPVAAPAPSDPVEPPAAELPSAAPASPAPPLRLALAAGEVRREPMSRLRRRVAERLVAAQHTAAMLTTFNEVNMQPVNELRQRYKAEFETRHGVKLGYMSFFVRAVSDALRQFPLLNAAIDGDEIVHPASQDIGIAVSTDRGLVVPVLRHAAQLDFARIEQAIGDFARRARSGALTLEELTGGTFSITNGGVFGSLLSTPILNPPQSGILGMHKIQERPVAENGQVVIRPMMYLALSYDHRLVDGREAVQFLVAVKTALESPERLLLSL
jgi:2-oxoglutarate dehydrogenase E2 component (dihydrolipoamide succinyltransferase)